jgi:hypothetical protein
MTARKTTPHLRRGPKPKLGPKPPQPPKRVVGRPDTPLSERPDRYVLAYSEALVMMGLSRRKAAQLFEMLYKGPITDITVDDDPPHRITIKVKTGDIDLGEFAKECDRLRALVKSRAPNAADLAWLTTMAEAVMIACEPWRPDARDTILRLAASMNETEWATQHLLPAVARRAPLPELAGNSSPT